MGQGTPDPYNMDLQRSRSKEQLSGSSVGVHNNLNHSHPNSHKYHSHQRKTQSPSGFSTNSVIQGLKFIPSSYNTRVNIVEALQEFWTNKLTNEGQEASTEACVIYESVPSSTGPYVCYVTLPGGSCFGTFQKSMTKAEARRSAAKLALMNSLYNDHPTRMINDAFISQSIDEAIQSAQGGEPEGLSAYRLMLETMKGKSMLQFHEMMTTFQLLHWNGSLRAMRERNCTRGEVIQHYSSRKIDDTMRRQMSLDWVAREQLQPGTIMEQLIEAEAELEESRKIGRELRLPKEKREILIMAQNHLNSAGAQ